MAKAPTFKSLKAAAEAGYHGKSVNIEGKGLQKVAFADKEYDKKMAARSAAAGKKDSVPVPPPRPTSQVKLEGFPIAEMKPSSASTQRSMTMRNRPITKTTEFAGRMQSAIDRARKKRK